jgi:hypothetical protein
MLQDRASFPISAWRPFGHKMKIEPLETMPQKTARFPYNGDKTRQFDSSNHVSGYIRPYEGTQRIVP